MVQMVVLRVCNMVLVFRVKVVSEQPRKPDRLRVLPDLGRRRTDLQVRLPWVA